MEGSELMLAHQSCDPMLATRFAGLTEIQEGPRGAVDTLARRERGADQAKQPGVLLRVVGNRLCKPCVVPARSDAEQTTHHLHAVLVSMRLNEFVRRTGSFGAQLVNIGHSSFGAIHCPPNPGNSTRRCTPSRAVFSETKLRDVT